MSNHSSLIGGSTAARLLQCPGSWKAIQALPPAVDRPSEYAEEGSFGHAVMDRLMYMRQAHEEQLGGVFNPFVITPRLLGEHFHDRQLTQAHLDDMIEPALVALAKLQAEYGGGFKVAGVEMRVAFPGVLGAFGTTDLLLISDTHAIVVDWKFGQGVPVRAVYTKPDGDTVNAQLLYYLTASLNTAGRLFSKRKLVVAIIQPRTDEPLTHAEITRKEVKWFREDVERAVLTALGRDPSLQKGEHCRWCPAKISCPEWTGPVLDIASLQPVARTEMVEKEITPYAQYLARAKALVDQLALFSTEVNDQLHAYLEDGGTVPGWKLKKKTKQRQWINEDKVEQALVDLGFELNEIWDSKLVTFAKADAAARRRGVLIPEHLRVAPPTNETTITTSDDPAPAVERHTAIEQFAASLADLRKQA